jgi:hypothetical protein
MTGSKRRSVGITASAVTVIVGSGLLALLAVGMVASMLLAGPTPELPPLARAITTVMGIFLFGCTGWGIATAIGLFRRRPWSRSSMLVFSALLALFATSCGFVTAFSPAPPAPRGVLTFLVFVYALMAGLGGFWLIYFTRAGVTAHFAIPDSPSARPLSVSVLGWFWLLGGLMCLAFTFTPLPTLVFGILLTGWNARVFYLISGTSSFWIGIGLLRLDSASRVGAMAMFVIYGLSAVAAALLPGAAERMQRLMAAMPAGLVSPGAPPAVAPSPLIALLYAGFAALPIYLLVSNREAFSRKA